MIRRLPYYVVRGSSYVALLMSVLLFITNDQRYFAAAAAFALPVIAIGGIALIAESRDRARGGREH